MRAIKRCSKYRNVIKGYSLSFDKRLGGGNVIAWGAGGQFRNLMAAPAAMSPAYPVYEDEFSTPSVLMDDAGVSAGYDVGGGGSYYYNPPEPVMEPAPMPVVSFQDPALGNFAPQTPIEIATLIVLANMTPATVEDAQIVEAASQMIAENNFSDDQLLKINESIATTGDVPVEFQELIAKPNIPAPTAPIEEIKVAANDIKQNALALLPAEISSKLGLTPASIDKKEIDPIYYIAGAVVAVGLLALLFKS